MHVNVYFALAKVHNNYEKHRYTSEPRFQKLYIINHSFKRHIAAFLHLIRIGVMIIMNNIKSINVNRRAMRERETYILV